MAFVMLSTFISAGNKIDFQSPKFRQSYPLKNQDSFQVILRSTLLLQVFVLKAVIFV